MDTDLLGYKISDDLLLHVCKNSSGFRSLLSIEVIRKVIAYSGILYGGPTRTSSRRLVLFHTLSTYGKLDVPLGRQRALLRYGLSKNI